MSNNLKTQSRLTTLWESRPVIVLLEDDATTYFHGVVVGSKGMSIARALKVLDNCYKKAVETYKEEWNYDDVFKEIKKNGFELINAAEWWENNVSGKLDRDDD
jgi:hypothetical protein